MANDIHSLINQSNVPDPDEVTPGDMGNQKLGRIVVRTGRGKFGVQDDGAQITGQNGPLADEDPNNTVAKYDDRYTHITYY